MTKKPQSASAKSGLVSPSDQEENGSALHIEIDRSKLEPLTKPGLAGHQWIQRGPYLVCQSCPVEHGVWIGMEMRLVGFRDDGTPILKRVGKVSRLRRAYPPRPLGQRIGRRGRPRRKRV